MKNSFNDTVTIVMDVVIASGAGAALDFIEEFDVNGMPPSGWNIENPDGSTTWAAKSVLGSDGVKYG